MKVCKIWWLAPVGLFVFLLSVLPMQAQSAAVAGQSQTAELDALLKKANSLYYSYAREGVTGFDCEVKPDWVQIVGAGDTRLPLLNAVTMRLHARVDGSSKLEWIDPPNATDPGGVLGKMHSAMDDTLTGFLQFWMPFIHGDVIPESAEGMGVHKSADGIVIHGEGAGVTLDEQLDNALNLKHYDVTMTNQLVKFEPGYKATAKGLLVNNFLARMGPPNATPEQMQEMHVSIDYQQVQGAEVPQRMKMEVKETGAVTVTMTGCTVVKK